MKNSIRCEITFMTPEMAVKLLGNKENRNRSVRRAVVERLTAACKAGEFVLHHQCIAVGPTGIVYDGQHRLWSIVNSGVGQWVVVAHYKTDECARAAMLVVDRQARRSLGDSLEILGMCGDKGRDRVAVVNVILLIQFGGSKCNETSTSSTEQNVGRLVVEYAEAHDAIRAKLGNKLSAAHAAPFVFARDIDPKAIDELALRLTRAEGLSATEAALHRLMSGNVFGGGGGTERLAFALKILRGIEACIDGESITKMQEQDRAKLVARMSKRLGHRSLYQATA